MKELTAQQIEKYDRLKKSLADMGSVAVAFPAVWIPLSF